MIIVMSINRKIMKVTHKMKHSLMTQLSGIKNKKIFSPCLGLASLATAACLFSSCSVVMAARKEGTSIENVQSSRSRGQILSQGGTIVSSERSPTGDLVEVYQFKKEKGSAARALMHGVLDVSTLGLWEVVGTPVEACLNDQKCYSVRVFYDFNENVTKMELL
jgi:hypothetical protein